MPSVDAVLGNNRYGKSGIRLVKVRRLADAHELTDLTLDVWLEGDFAAAHTDGDNAAVLPTDTLRGTVYAFAADSDVADVERFALALGRHFLEATPAARLAGVDTSEQPWQRLTSGGAAHPFAFTAAAGGLRTARVTTSRDGGASVTGGVRGLQVLKTSGSAFSGFLRDEYTTLPETRDRILATTVDANWTYRSPDADFDACHSAVLRTVTETFADHASESVQHTLYAMGAAVLAQRPEVEDISFSLPNRHHLGVDVSVYGRSDDRSVFVAADRPFGLIQATVTRPDPSAA